MLCVAASVTRLRLLENLLGAFHEEDKNFNWRDDVHGGHIDGAWGSSRPTWSEQVGAEYCRQILQCHLVFVRMISNADGERRREMYHEVME